MGLAQNNVNKKLPCSMEVTDQLETILSQRIQYPETVAVLMSTIL